MADEKELEDIKRLPPEERIAKLRELEEKRKKEIEQAKELVKESVDEIAKEEEEKFIEEGVIKQEEERAERVVGDDLEETVAKEAPKLTEEELKAHNQYINHLREETKTTDLYSIAKNIAQDVKESGYMTAEQQHRLSDLDRAEQYKKQDMQSGKYKTTGEEIADTLSATRGIINSLKGYKR